MSDGWVMIHFVISVGCLYGMYTIQCTVHMPCGQGSLYQIVGYDCVAFVLASKTFTGLTHGQGIRARESL